MAEQDVQGMLIRIEATAAQLISELGRADRAVASTSQKIDKSLSVVDQAFGRIDSTISGAVDKALGDLNASVSAAYAHLDRLDSGLTGVQQASTKVAPGLNASTAAMGKAGISAGQYAQAMRLLPMQLSDVVSSLASGMPVWQVAIQQGGQVRDAFGGIGNAARGVASAVGPVAGTFGAIAAAAAVLLSAHEKGAAEARAYEQALILTGNAAGTSADALAGMAVALDNSGTTQHAAAAALAEVAGTGKFAENQIGAIAEAALAMEQATGKAVGATVKEFTALADAPAAASAKLNEQYHYLTASVYEQIRALEEQGRTTEAAKLATDTYAAAMQERAGQIDENLGILQRAWRDVGDIASEAWDAMLGIGREKTLEQQIAQLEGQLQNLQKNPYTDSFLHFGPSEEELNNALLGLRIRQQGQALIAESAAEEAQLNQERIAASQREQKAQDSLNQSFVSQLVNLKQSAALQGQNSEEARVRYETELGGLAKLGDAQKQALIDEAKKVDAKRAAEKATQDQAAASKKATEAQKREAEAFQQLLDTLLPAEAASRKYTDTIGKLDKGLIAGSLSLDTYQSAVESAWQALNKAEWDKQSQQVKEANDQFKSLADRLDPAAAAAEQYAKDQAILNQRLAQGNISAEEYARLLGLLDQEYRKNSASSSEWAKFTERQLDRVDQAFSDAWLNIGHGFDSFSSGLKRAFDQMLAELAHMAITRPIMLQIGSALGIGSSTQALAGGSSGIWGGLSSGLSATGSGLSLYNGASGLLGAGVATADTSAVGASIAGYTSPQYASWVAGQSGIGSISSALSAWAAPVSAAFGLIKGFTSYLDGERVDAKGSRGSIAAWATGYQPFAELNGAINKLTKMIGLDGTIIGGLINAPGMILQGIGNALFGKWKIKDYGIALGVNDGDLNPQNYVYKKKKGLLTGTKKKTSYDPLTGDSAQQLQEAFATTEDGVASIFEQLGYAIDDGTYAGLQIARAKISTKGKTKEQISQAISNWFTKAGESINSYLNTTLGTGLDYNVEQMTTFVNNLYSVNGILDDLNVGLFATNVAGGKMVEDLLAIAGGLDALTTSVSTYYDQFFSDAEKQANTLENVTQAFSSANLSLPKTRAEYRSMVESIDLTTESGRQMFASLMSMAGAADSYYDVLEGRSATVLANIQGYYDKFSTEAERQNDTLQSVTAQFQALGVSLPATRSGFVALVGGLDQTSEAGRSMFETLMSLAGAADSYYSILEQRAADAQAAAEQAAAAVAQAESNYYSLFASTTRQASDSIESAIRQIGELGIVLPASRNQYAALVDSIDTGTEAGQRLRAALVGMASAADTAYGSIDTLRANAQSAVEAANQAGQQAVSAAEQAVQSAYQSSASALQQTIDQFDQLEQALQSFSDSLGETIRGTLAPTAQLDALRRQFATTAASAGLGNQKAMSDLPGIGNQLASAALDFSATREDYLRELARMQQAASAAEGTAGRQKTIAQQQLDTLDAQMAQLGLLDQHQQSFAEAVVALLRAQLDAAQQLSFAQVAAFRTEIQWSVSRTEALLGTSGALLSAIGDNLDSLDTTADGLLDQNELKAALVDTGLLGAGDLPAFVAMLDRNRDGVVSALEAQNVKLAVAASSVDQRFAALDKNVDGLLDQDELTAALVDTGLLTGEEFSGLYDALDANHDGLINTLELGNVALVEAFGQFADDVNGVYREVLGRNADAGGLKFWADLLSTGALAPADLPGAILASANGGADQSAATSYASSLVASAYQMVLGRTVDAGGLGWWTQQLLSGQVAPRTLNEMLAGSAFSGAYAPDQAAAGHYLKIPGYAAGGDFGGGLRLVGENGPELEVTGPSRIFNARQTADLLAGGAASVEEIRGLRADISRVFDALRSIAKHTMRTSQNTELMPRWDADGLPAMRA